MQGSKWQVGTRTCRYQHWEAFGKELGRLILCLTEADRRFLVIGSQDPCRYVQFASLMNGGVKAEAVSNYYLAKGEKLTAATCRALVKCGWRGPRKRGNFWRRWRSPAPMPEIVWLALSTLRDTFGVVSPADLQVTRGVFPSKAGQPT